MRASRAARTMSIGMLIKNDASQAEVRGKRGALRLVTMVRQTPPSRDR
jgi:hypothetical protein